MNGSLERVILTHFFISSYVICNSNGEVERRMPNMPQEKAEGYAKVRSYYG